jgi:hypothetical protein
MNGKDAQLTDPNIHDCANQRNEIDMLRARGRLSDAKKWFAHRGWSVLPQNDRGRSILRWGADHAWLAAETDRKRKGSVRRWCRRWAPRLSDAELDRIVADTVNSNKRWSHDQSAAVLEITVRDRQLHGFRFIGADDDPDYLIRDELKRSKAAERARRYRARKSTGAKRGRPKSKGVPAWKAAGFGSPRSYYRHKVRGTESAQRGTKNASRDISKSIQRDGISVPPIANSGAQQAPQRRAPIIDVVLEGEIVVDDGDDSVGLMPPPNPSDSPPQTQLGV